MPLPSWAPGPPVWRANRKSSPDADMALCAPAKDTSSILRSHRAAWPLQPASSIPSRSRLGARTALTKDMPPRSSTTENVATPVVPPSARRRGVTRWRPVPSWRATHQDDAPIRSNTQTTPRTTSATARIRTSTSATASGQMSPTSPMTMAPTAATAWPGDGPGWPARTRPLR